MRICIDIQSAISQIAGVGRYTRNLAQHLGALAGHDTLLLFYFDFMRKGMPFPVEHAVARPVRWVPGRLVQQSWKSWNMPPFDWFAGRADVYHFPNFILPPLKKGKSAVTIHDMSFARYPEFAEEKNLRYLSTRISDTAARADMIITDSRFSAGEIQSFLNRPASQITSIYPGIDTSFGAPAQETVKAILSGLDLHRPYLLFVGTLEPRKNIPFLIEFFEKFEKFDGDLVIAGRPGWRYEPILERINRSPRKERIRILSGIGDAELPALYAGAEMFVFPSLYEGFGFPPLEAMACGTPVLSSSLGSLGEVLGSGAVLLNRFDTEEWIHEAQLLLEDSGKRALLTQKGREQVARYTWPETARQTWAIYRSLGN